MKKPIYRTFFALFFALSLTLTIISCSEDEDDASADCVGCDSDAPFSTVASSSCYETLSECTDALGSGCTRCD